MAIELVLQKYPKTLKMKDGSSCRVRPLRKDDEKAFHEFFLSLPEQERMFIKHRVTQPEVIRDWCRNIDLGRNLPLLALVDGRIIADTTLHQQLGGWKRHIGRVSVLVHPEHRGRGLAAGLIGHLVQAHRRDGLTSWLHVGAPNTRAIDLYLHLGFKRVQNLTLRRISRTD